MPAFLSRIWKIENIGKYAEIKRITKETNFKNFVIPKIGNIIRNWAIKNNLGYIRGDVLATANRPNNGYLIELYNDDYKYDYIRTCLIDMATERTLLAGMKRINIFTYPSAGYTYTLKEQRQYSQPTPTELKKTVSFFANNGKLIGSTCSIKIYTIDRDNTNFIRHRPYLLDRPYIFVIV